MVYAKLGAKVTVVEALPGDPDRQRHGLRPGGGAQAQEAGRRGDDRRQGEVVEREGRPRRGRRRRRGGKDVTLDADKVLVSVGRRPNSEGLGLEELGVKIETRLHHRRQAPAHQRPRHLRDRRRRRAADAGAQGVEGGGGRRRGDRRPQGRVRRAQHPRRHLHRSGDRVGRHHRGRGRSSAAARSRSASSRSSALGRAIANADTDGFVKVDHRRGDEGGAGHPHRRQRRVATSSPRRRWRSRWARWPTTSA